jgi:hypothetical protein
MNLTKTLLILALAAGGLRLAAQPYVEGGNTRHRFAQLNLGIEARSFLNQGTAAFFPGANGALEQRQLAPQRQAAFVIGGTHFWGYADFYVAFAFLNLYQTGYKPRTETGLKAYPWRIEHRKLRPYIGTTWMTSSYQQGEGALIARNETPLLGGLTYCQDRLLIELGAAYSFKPSWPYYVSMEQQAPTVTHALRLSLGAKWMIETTLSAEKDWLSGRAQMLTDTLGKLGRLNSFTLAAGPSSAFFVNGSGHNRGSRSFLGQHLLNRIFPEFGAGYYWHQPDLQLNLAYRNISSTLEAYGHAQHANRQALTLEAFKFFADYHGFAPFAGLALSREWLSLTDQSPQREAAVYRAGLLRPGLAFGWDIRPNRLQVFYLRTNLRWFPKLELAAEGGQAFSFSQIEFNFIQLVLMMDRLF